MSINKGFEIDAYVVTDCVTHGVRMTSDYESARVYVEAALQCQQERLTEDGDTHHYWHAQQGHECWYCCSNMVTDPHGIFDC